MHATERCCSDAIMDVISDESATVSQVSAAMRATCSGQDEAAPITAAGNRVPSFSVELLEVEPVNVKVLEMQPSSNNRVLPVPRCTVQGHLMVESKHGGRDGWCCRHCDDWFQAGQAERWFCAQCDEDICFSCWPNEKPMAAAALDDSTICNFTEPLTPVCLVCKGHSLKQMVIASGILNSCDMCHYVLRGGNDIWWCSECEWGICSSECAVAAADVHHAATQWRQCTKEQPVRTWVAVCGQPAFVAMPALELRKLLFDKSKSRRRICASVYNYATTKWDPQRAQVNDIYIENKKQRAERKRLALSNYHQATRLLKRKRTARRIPDEVLPWLPCEHSLIYNCVRFRSFLRQSNSKPPHQSCCVPSRGKGPAMAWWARVL